jgi:hypothetical protein
MPVVQVNKGTSKSSMPNWPQMPPPLPFPGRALHWRTESKAKANAKAKESPLMQSVGSLPRHKLKWRPGIRHAEWKKEMLGWSVAGQCQGSLPLQARELAYKAVYGWAKASIGSGILERKERLHTARARKPVACCSGEGWAFIDA